MNERPTVLKIENVKKKYIIKHVQQKEKLPKTKIGRMIASNETIKEDFWALSGVSFEVKKGEKVGIIGKNGAGKSTLLKTISRITEPSDGRIEILGNVASMLEVGTGFNHELTGRENVYLNGAILGMTKAEVDKKFDAIVEFSEVGDFIDTPVKRYSSGMFVRLAFAVAAHLESDILLVDEVLAVGDTRFQKKCIDKMKEIAESGRTILFVSHQMNTIRQLCERVVVLKEGKVIHDGNVEEGIRLYNSEAYLDLNTHHDYRNLNRKFQAKGAAEIETFDLLGNTSCTFNYDEPIEFKLHIKAKEDNIGDMTLRVMAFKDGTAPICVYFSKVFAHVDKKGEFDIRVKMHDHRLGPGLYTAALNLNAGTPTSRDKHLDIIENAFTFEVLHFDGTAREWPIQWGSIRNEAVDVDVVSE